MPLPLIVPIAAAAFSAASPFIGRALAGKRPRTPDAPDLVSPILAELSNRRSENERDLQFRNLRDIEATRASGVNSVVAADFRNQTVGQANDLRRRLDSIIADRIGQAERQQQLLNFEAEQIKFQDNLNRYNNRAQAIGNIVGSVANIGLTAASGGFGGGGSNPAAAALANIQPGVNPGSAPQLLNFQNAGLASDVANQLYITGRSNEFNAPGLNYTPPSTQPGFSLGGFSGIGNSFGASGRTINGSVPSSSLFQFQDASRFSNQLPRF